VPGAFKARVQSEDTVARMATLMIRHAAHLVRLREKTGHTIALALEAEPCCFLETLDETIGPLMKPLVFSNRTSSPRRR
jgi:hypothetical protein